MRLCKNNKASHLNTHQLSKLITFLCFLYFSLTQVEVLGGLRAKRQEDDLNQNKQQRKGKENTPSIKITIWGSQHLENNNKSDNINIKKKKKTMSFKKLLKDSKKMIL